uniref:hypothetical protein n=1 Tax=Burkholderia mallei TaxID=13373 RepID=UPI0023604468
MGTGHDRTLRWRDRPCDERPRAGNRAWPSPCDTGPRIPTHTAPKKKRRRIAGVQIADKPSPSGGFLFFNGVMLKTPMPTQHELEMVTLEELVPK